MEFKSLKNIETSFRQIRLFTLVFACLCAVVTGFALWKSYSFAEAQRQKIYVLDNGKSLMLALSQDVRQNRPVEAREHVRRFHELFFTLSPDKSAIEGNIKRSLLLADKSAFNYYKDLSEKGYYNRIISGNINQMIEIDSLRCDFDKYPYSVRTFARQIILRESSVTERSLVTRCRLLDAVRSDNNPQASSSRVRDHGKQGFADPQTLTAMIRKFITKAQDWADGKLRRLAGRISPDMRVAIILVMLAAFGALSVYMTVSSIYRIGRNDGKELGIEHIRRLQLPNDSIINPFESGRHGTGGEVE